MRVSSPKPGLGPEEGLGGWGGGGGGGRLKDNTTSWKIPKPRKWLLQLRRPENADSATSALHAGGYLNRRPFWRMKKDKNLAKTTKSLGNHI